MGVGEKTMGSHIGHVFDRWLALGKNSLGLAIAYIGWPIATNGDICGPRSTLLADGTSLVTLLPLLILLLALHRGRFHFSEKVHGRIAVAAVLFEAASLFSMGTLGSLGLCTEEVRFWLCIPLAVATVVVVSCWLQRARGASMQTAIVFVFAALLVNAILQFGLRLIPGAAEALVAGAVTLLQLLDIRKNKPLPLGPDSASTADDYFAFLRSGRANKRFLVACAIGLMAISLVAGFLCGFPNDEPKTLGTAAEVLLLALTAALCLVVIGAAIRDDRRMMMIGVWIVMELLAAIALVLYNAFSGNLEPGTVAARLLDVAMTGMVWHLMIALMDYGWRQPFYYVNVTWLMWLGSHDLGRLLLAVLPIGGNNHFTGALISLFLLVSTQIILVKLIDVARFAEHESISSSAMRGRVGAIASASSSRAGAFASASTLRSGAFSACSQGHDIPLRPAAPNGGSIDLPEMSAMDVLPLGVAPGGASEAAAMAGLLNEEDAGAERFEKATAFERLLGLDVQEEKGDFHLRAMRERAANMGELFLLSEREVDVLALYALGYTQKRVAEELYVSPTTVHTHITRIYAKTNLHSRQEILDFMRQHAEQPDGADA